MTFGLRAQFSRGSLCFTSCSFSSTGFTSTFGISSPAEPADAVLVASQPMGLHAVSVEASPCLTFIWPFGQSASYCRVGSGPSGAAQENVLVTLLILYFPLRKPGCLVIAMTMGGTRCSSV